MLEKVIKGTANYGIDKCAGDEFFSIGDTGNVGHGRHLDIDNWPEEFFDFIEHNNGKKIKLTLKLELCE